MDWVRSSNLEPFEWFERFGGTLLSIFSLTMVTIVTMA